MRSAGRSSRSGRNRSTPPQTPAWRAGTQASSGFCTQIAESSTKRPKSKAYQDGAEAEATLRAYATDGANFETWYTKHGFTAMFPRNCRSRSSPHLSSRTSQCAIAG
jgi:hypothetical protein